MSDSTLRRPVDWPCCAQTDVGTVRKINEDSVLGDTSRNLWAVADGMGGHAVGEVASQKIIAALNDVQLGSSLSQSADAIEDALLDINEHIIGYADIMFDDATMGSTIVTLHIHDRVGFCVWAGDSRLYRLRNGRLEQLSRDHSQVEEMVKMGILRPEDAQSHPNSNVITRAVGIEHDLVLDINVFGAQVGDTFLLCSDGLYNSVAENDIIERLKNKSVEQCSSDLMAQALNNKANDNVSVVVVKGVARKIR